MKNIIFWGGTGQCKVMRPISEMLDMKLVAVFDDTDDLNPPFKNIPLLHGNDFQNWSNNKQLEDYYFSVTIGNPNAQVRIDISNRLEGEYKLKPMSLIHPTSCIDDRFSIGKGAQIHAGVIINPYVKIGDYCIINTGAIVEHDDVLNDGVELGPGATLCGEVEIGENTWIGAGSVIRQRVKIGSNCIIGAGSVIIDNIPDGKTVVGSPARRFL
jgi:sugar O-acyltransferase (sialic acid O-acetyltransferase NeuD family)